MRIPHAIHDHGTRHQSKHRLAGFYDDVYPYDYDTCSGPYRLHRHRRWVCG
jgi:hypothetical protein